jgi:hypothetical protein
MNSETSKLSRAKKYLGNGCGLNAVPSHAPYPIRDTAVLLLKNNDKNKLMATPF